MGELYLYAGNAYVFCLRTFFTFCAFQFINKELIIVNHPSKSVSRIVPKLLIGCEKVLELFCLPLPCSSKLKFCQTVHADMACLFHCCNSSINILCLSALNLVAFYFCMGDRKFGVFKRLLHLNWNLNIRSGMAVHSFVISLERAHDMGDR